MIRRPEEFSAGETIEADVAVVGGGPIGVVTALELARSGAQVALIESGHERVDQAAQDLATLSSRQDDYFHSRSELTVRRQVGGTTALWGGRCVKFDPIDFEDRAISVQAPWPIGYEDVEPYLQRACDWAVCGRAAFNARDIPDIAHRDMVVGLPDGDVRTTDLERWSLPTRFGHQYRAALRNAPRLVVWTGLTCTEIVTTEAGDSVDHLVVKTLDGREGRVVAANYVVATGGLEATRLLLASDRHHPAGLGNEGGHLGRWYMAHVEGRVARVHFATDQVIYGYERDNEGVYVRRRFTIDPRRQREFGMPNAAVWLVNRPISDPSHGSGILSGVYLTLISPVGRFMLAAAIRKAHTKADGSPRILAHLRNIVRDLFPSIRFAVTFFYARFLRKGRKAPGFFLKSADNRYLLHYHGEHLPHWESRVELADERDALGMRRIRTHMHFSDADYESVRKAITVIDEHLRRHAVGHVEWLTDDVEGSVHAYLRENAGFHQAGTTRMSKTAEGGVVDPHLQVHGVRGLYVASTSVLPTSSQANPTLLGIALGVRLAERLAKARMEGLPHDGATHPSRPPTGGHLTQLTWRVKSSRRTAGDLRQTADALSSRKARPSRFRSRPVRLPQQF
ncbi:MAG TPA: GMC oxidoreductase [Candidatus Baltobacteraceae bacterium]|nr:GMC oxidoreductase [Candidatus Baltobacteraceae bacterium]